jgi:hypothetical protein
MRGWTAALVAGVAVAGGLGAPALAHDGPGGSADTGAAPAPGPTTLRWRGTTLSFDQSATTQTLGLGGDYQSANPTYEWWLAFRPRYTVYERGANAVSVNGWLNVYLELTDSDTTTRRREVLLGPTYAWATYRHAFAQRRGYETSVNAGPRLILPTDKAAFDSGQVITLGAFAGASQTFPLRGPDARVLRGARLGATVTFHHPFSRATAPVNEDLRQLRQDVAGRLIQSDQLRGQMNVENALNFTLSGELQLARRLAFSASYVLLNAWAYPVSDAALCTLRTGCVEPMSVSDPTTYRASSWLTGALAFDATRELEVSLGYYNLASQLAPDGTRRNPLWSPSARLFLTVTGNLDVVYQRVSGRGP